MTTLGQRGAKAATIGLPARRLAAALGAAAVLAQVAYPLMSDGRARDLLTMTIVLLFFAASVSHALVHRGPRWTAQLVVVTAGGGLAAESIGTRTGVPFGDYVYADSLGRALFDVPLVIPLAWTMMAYPALLIGRRLARTRLGATAVAALALASWDLFLDPQMVDAGHWRWLDVQAELPGIDGVPVSNFAGWLLVAGLMMTVLSAALPPDTPQNRPDDRLPFALYLWTYASSMLGHLVFFGRPGVAVVGGLVMGLVAVPLARSLLGSRRPA